MDKKMKQNLILIAFGVVLYAALMHIGTVIGFLGKIVNLAVPVVAGFVIAFVLNVPMTGIEKQLCKLSAKGKRQLPAGLITGVSLGLTLVIVALILFLVGKMLVPELTASVVSLYEVVMDKVPLLVDLLGRYDIDISWAMNWLESLNIGQLLQKVTMGAGSVISSAVNIAVSAVSGVTNAVLALIIAFYVLLGKKDLARQCTMLAKAYLKASVADYLIRVAKLVKDLYSKFLSGQCLEACVLGGLMVIFLGIFRVPYAVLIGLLAAVGTLIPYVGSFASCAIGAFLVLLADPGKVLVCIIVYLVVQFVENQFIYPHVVGTSVGLSALWTLVAVLVGGKLMGLLGMIFFIPLTAVLVTLLRERTEYVMARKNAVTVIKQTQEEETSGE